MTNKEVTGTGTDSSCIQCGETMDIAAVTEFRTQLMEALETRQALTLDASKVERADTAALQLLSTFIQDADSQQQVVQWKDPTQALRQSAALLGLSELLHFAPTPE